MAITKISAAELAAKARDFTSEETAYFDSLSPEDIERAALTDPDARPWTSDMLRRGQADRRKRLHHEQLMSLGCFLVEANANLDLPVWEVTDQDGRTVLIQAADVHRVASGREAVTKVLKLETAEPTSVGTPPERHRR